LLENNKSLNHDKREELLIYIFVFSVAESECIFILVRTF